LGFRNFISRDNFNDFTNGCVSHGGKYVLIQRLKPSSEIKIIIKKVIIILNININNNNNFRLAI